MITFDGDGHGDVMCEQAFRGQHFSPGERVFPPDTRRLSVPSLPVDLRPVPDPKGREKLFYSKGVLFSETYYTEIHIIRRLFFFLRGGWALWSRRAQNVSTGTSSPLNFVTKNSFQEHP